MWPKNPGNRDVWQGPFSLHPPLQASCKSPNTKLYKSPIKNYRKEQTVFVLKLPKLSFFLFSLIYKKCVDRVYTKKHVDRINSAGI